MPRASDHAILVQEAFAERSALMRTESIEDEEASIQMKDREDVVPDLDVTAGARRDVGGASDPDEVRAHAGEVSTPPGSG